jgi:hypothetical protein
MPIQDYGVLKAVRYRESAQQPQARITGYW